MSFYRKKLPKEQQNVWNAGIVPQILAGPLPLQEVPLESIAGLPALKAAAAADKRPLPMAVAAGLVVAATAQPTAAPIQARALLPAASSTPVTAVKASALTAGGTQSLAPKGDTGKRGRSSGATGQAKPLAKKAADAIRGGCGAGSRAPGSVVSCVDDCRRADGGNGAPAVQGMGFQASSGSGGYLLGSTMQTNQPYLTSPVPVASGYHARGNFTGALNYGYGVMGQESFNTSVGGGDGRSCNGYSGRAVLAYCGGIPDPSSVSTYGVARGNGGGNHSASYSYWEPLLHGDPFPGAAFDAHSGSLS